MTVDIWIRDYYPPRCFQKKISGREISGRGKHNVRVYMLFPGLNVSCHCDCARAHPDRSAFINQIVCKASEALEISCTFSTLT
jgi:hypothetical protein